MQPFADEKVLGIATRLGLPDSACDLVVLAGPEDLSVVGAALIRCDRADDADELRT